MNTEETLCLFCGGAASASDHLLHCDGRQGHVEAAPILDAARGERLREVAIAHVDAGVPEDFKARALHAVWVTAHACAEFTSDQVWVRLGEEGQWHHEKRALGPVMREASGHRWIAPTDRFVLTAQPLRHRAPVRVWRSLIHHSVITQQETP